jgi:hypothetical protein
VQHGQAALQRELVLGVVLPERAGHDDRVGVVGQVRGVVPDGDHGTELAQRRDVRGVAHVGSGDAVPVAQRRVGRCRS